MDRQDILLLDTTWTEIVTVSINKREDFHTTLGPSCLVIAGTSRRKWFRVYKRQKCAVGKVRVDPEPLLVKRLFVPVEQ